MRWLPLITALLLATAHRLPAPIQEIPESATPAPAEQAKPKKTQSKSRAVESEAKTESAPKLSAMPKLQGPARFTGTWTGTINQGILGTPQVKIVVNSNATLVTHSSNLSGEMGTHAATINGDTLKWHTGWGWANGLTWTLTLKADGQTAVTTSKSLVAAYGPATFSRTQGTELSRR
jgi:hypothetical protein